MRSVMRPTLALIVVVGFQAILAAMLAGWTSVLENSTMTMMLGSLSTAFGVVLQWYFGSSSGSERKSDLLAQSAPAAAGPMPAIPTDPGGTA